MTRAQCVRRSWSHHDRASRRTQACIRGVASFSSVRFSNVSRLAFWSLYRPRPFIRVLLSLVGYVRADYCGVLAAAAAAAADGIAPIYLRARLRQTSKTTRLRRTI
jgi:hypothetical protein